MPPTYDWLQTSTSPTSGAAIGGYVYRGCRMPDLRGTYFYADFCAANIESFRTDETCSLSTELTRTADLNDDVDTHSVCNFSCGFMPIGGILVVHDMISTQNI